MPQLANQESRGFTHSFRITGAELASSGYLTSSQKTVAQLPIGGIVTHAAVFQQRRDIDLEYNIKMKMD